MIINKIDVRNFRGKNYSLKPSKLNLFLAPNGSGKTTLCDAIRYGLTGQLPADSPTGMSVRLEFDQGAIERGKKANGSTYCKINDSAVTGKALDQFIEDELMASPENIRISSSTEALMDMKPEKFSEFIIKQIPEQLNYDMVMGWFDGADDRIKKTCAALLPAMPEEFDISRIEEAYKLAYQKRKEMKQKLADVTGAYNSNNALEPVMTAKQIAAEEKKLQEAYAGQAEIAKKRKEYETAKAKRAEQEAQLKELNEAAAKLKDTVPTKDMKQRIEAVTEKHQSQQTMLKEQLAALNKDIAFLSKVLENLKKPVCPIHNKLRCTTDKTAVQGEVQAMLKEKQDTVSKAENQLKAAEEGLKKCKFNQNKFDELVKKHAEFQKMTAQADTLKKNLVTVPEEPKAALSMTEEQYQAKKKELDNAKLAIEAWAKKLQLIKDIKNYTEQVRILEAIVAAFAPKGSVKMKIIAFYFDILETECDSLSKKFGEGYKIRLSADNGVKIMAQTPKSGEARSIEALSGGERATAMFLIMATLNQLSNSGIMFFDNVEILDKEALAKLRKMIIDDDFLDTFDHLFVCGVNHEELSEMFSGAGMQEVPLPSRTVTNAKDAKTAA